MAASRTTLLVMGLVVLATVLAGAEATNHTVSHPGLDKLKSLVVDLEVSATKCGSPLQVLVLDVIKHLQPKAHKLCPGGKVTELEALTLELKVPGVLRLYVELFDKKGKVVVAKLTLLLKLEEVVVAVVDKVYLVVLQVVLDLKHKRLLFLSGSKQVYILNLSLDVVLSLGLEL